MHWLHERLGPAVLVARAARQDEVGSAQRYIATFRDASLQAAEAAGVDGIVCGHIHKAELVERDGLAYCNDGDWVESCTALVERPDGELELLTWPTQAALAPVASAAARRGVIEVLLPLRVRRAARLEPGRL